MCVCIYRAVNTHIHMHAYVCLSVYTQTPICIVSLFLGGWEEFISPRETQTCTQTNIFLSFFLSHNCINQ